MFSAGEGVGLRDETCVMVGETGGEACAGPGRERDLCICIMTPSGRGLVATSSFPASRSQSSK